MSKKTEILDIAEQMIRTRGYNGFSTRDIADAAGIKAASVHYHFPTKEDLGASVTERYTTRFLETLGEPTRFHDAPDDGIALYISAFRTALLSDRMLCLCAVLGAEIVGLPPAVGAGARVFFDANLDWLKALLLAGGGLTAQQARARAHMIMSGLEGALMIAFAKGDDQIFEDVAAALKA